MKVINVTQNGSIKWKSYFWVYMSGGLIGKQVAVEEIGKCIWKVFYRNVFLDTLMKMIMNYPAASGRGIKNLPHWLISPQVAGN